jgi:hypothetical protein
MNGADDRTLYRALAAVYASLAAIGVFAQIPADITPPDTRGAEDVYTRVPPRKDLVPINTSGLGRPIAPRDRRIKGDLLTVHDRIENFYWASDDIERYTSVPAISSDGKLAFLVDTVPDKNRPDDENPPWSAILLDIDTSSIVWKKTLFDPDECNEDDPACIELVNLRKQAINAELSPRGWVRPELCDADPTTDPGYSCGQNDDEDDPFREECVWPRLKVIYDPPRLFAIAENGRVVLDKLFPRCEYKGDEDEDCHPIEGRWKSYPGTWEMGFDRERRVMSVSFFPCWVRCKWKRYTFIFRLPKL